MLKNIIFDMGGVLIAYDPPLFISRLNLSPEDESILLKEIFRSADWPLCDEGEINEAELERRVFERIPPRLREAAHRLIFSWERPITPIPGMEQLVRDCKAAGLGIYLLSNASVRQIEYWPDIPGSDCFDGRVVSAEVRMLKPGPGIFRHLLDTYSLSADECLFIDDTAANADGARAVGMNAFHFTGDVEELRKVIFPA